MRITCGLSSAARRTASATVAAVPTTAISACRPMTSRRLSVNDSWSSTIRTRIASDAGIGSATHDLGTERVADRVEKLPTRERLLQQQTSLLDRTLPRDDLARVPR